MVILKKEGNWGQCNDTTLCLTTKYCNLLKKKRRRKKARGLLVNWLKIPRGMDEADKIANGEILSGDQTTPGP